MSTTILRKYSKQFIHKLSEVVKANGNCEFTRYKIIAGDDYSAEPFLKPINCNIDNSDIYLIEKTHYFYIPFCINDCMFYFKKQEPVHGNVEYDYPNQTFQYYFDHFRDKYDQIIGVYDFCASCGFTRLPHHVYGYFINSSINFFFDKGCKSCECGQSIQLKRIWKISKTRYQQEIDRMGRKAYFPREYFEDMIVITNPDAKTNETQIKKKFQSQFRFQEKRKIARFSIPEIESLDTDSDIDEEEDISNNDDIDETSVSYNESDNGIVRGLVILENGTVKVKVDFDNFDSFSLEYEDKWIAHKCKCYCPLCNKKNYEKIKIRLSEEKDPFDFRDHIPNINELMLKKDGKYINENNLHSILLDNIEEIKLACHHKPELKSHLSPYVQKVLSTVTYHTKEIKDYLRDESKLYESMQLKEQKKYIEDLDKLRRKKEKMFS